MFGFHPSDNANGGRFLRKNNFGRGQKFVCDDGDAVVDDDDIVVVVVAAAAALQCDVLEVDGM